MKRFIIRIDDVHEGMNFVRFNDFINTLDILSIKPIILFDEVCSHLDEINRRILLTLVESFDLQIFMTGTTRNLFSFLSTNSNFCNITN